MEAIRGSRPNLDIIHPFVSGVMNAVACAAEGHDAQKDQRGDEQHPGYRETMVSTSEHNHSSPFS